jgi:hypothetical protein
MTLINEKNEKIEFLSRFFDKIFGGMGECLYISDRYTEITELMTSLECQTVVDYSQIENGEFEGIKFNGFFGCTKAVFLFEGWDIVIKIPFNGNYYYDPDTNEPIFTDIPNHIVLEDQIYEDASDEMQKILLKNKYLFNYNNLEVYAQTAIAETEDKRTHSILTPELLDKAQAARNSRSFGYKNPCNNFLAAIMLQYPNTYDEIFDELCNIKDMHRGNYGYLANGMVAIHDYGGYSEWT